MKTNSIIFCNLLLTTIVGISSLNLAQHRPTTADIRVTTRDQLEGIVSGADVIVVNADNGLRRHVKTDMRGTADVPALPPGPYTIEAAMPQFITEIRRVQLPLGTMLEVHLTLTVQGASEQITVTADAEPANVHPGSGSVISRRRIDGLPANGRNFISFALTTSGVSTDRMPQQGASATSGLSFAGQRARSNNITVDGVDNNDAALGAVRATFSQEAVQEFQVLGTSYPAEFGKASGGVINIVTRSGTNRTSGNAFAYMRHHALNARDYFEDFDVAGNRIHREKARYSQFQTGGTLGGAIQPDKTFYFVSFERLDIRANNFVTINDSAPVMLAATSLGTPAQVLRDAGFAVETGSVPYRARSDSFLLKTDHQFSPRQTLAIRFNHASVLNENGEAWGGLVGRSRGGALESTDRAAALSHVWIRSRALVNELRAQYALRRQNVLSLDPSCGGRCVVDDQGGPTIEVTGFAYLGRHRFTPQPRSSRRWQVVDTVSLHSDRHLFKAGLDGSVIYNHNERLPLHFGGRYVFAATLPGPLPDLPYENINAIQAVALGLPAVYVQGYGNPEASYVVADASVFVQDDWQPTPSLTIGMGVRYQKQFWPGVFPTDNNNLAPRLSLAWGLGSADRTTVHSSYGLFFDNQLTMLPAVTGILDGNEGVRTLAVQFPDPLLVAAWNAPGRRLPEANTGAYPSAKFVVDPRLRTPFAHHFTGGVTQRWNSNIFASIDGVVVRGHGQLGTIDYNPILPDLGAGRRPEDVNAVAGTSASILQFTSFGSTWYRGLNLSFHARQKDRAEISVAYTLSNARDTSTDYQSAFIPQNNGRGRATAGSDGLPADFNPLAEKGLSVQDQRHRLVMNGLYELPWNTTVAWVLNAGSGRPYSVIAGADLNGDGNGGAFPSDRARRDPSLESTSLPRNSARLPGNFTLDARLSRTFELGRGLQLQTMLEVFNISNRANFTEVNNVFGAGAYPHHPLPTYGRYTQAAPMRQAQIALKLAY